MYGVSGGYRPVAYMVAVTTVLLQRYPRLYVMDNVLRAILEGFVEVDYGGETTFVSYLLVSKL